MELLQGNSVVMCAQVLVYESDLLKQNYMKDFKELSGTKSFIHKNGEWTDAIRICNFSGFGLQCRGDCSWFHAQLKAPQQIRNCTVYRRRRLALQYTACVQDRKGAERDGNTYPTWSFASD